MDLCPFRSLSFNVKVVASSNKKRMKVVFIFRILSLKLGIMIIILFLYFLYFSFFYLFY